MTMAKPTRKYQGADERCPKCGHNNHRLSCARYTNPDPTGPGTYDVLMVKCARCEAGWEVLPLDAEVPRPPAKMAKVLVEILNPIVMTEMSRGSLDHRGDSCTLTVRVFGGKYQTDRNYTFDVPLDHESYRALQEAFALGKYNLKLAVVEV